jgi:hypothetical protein
VYKRQMHSEYDMRMPTAAQRSAFEYRIHSSHYTSSGTCDHSHVCACHSTFPVLGPKSLRHIVVLLQCCVQPLVCHIAQLAQMIKFAKAQQPGWEPCYSEGLAKHLYISEAVMNCTQSESCCCVNTSSCGMRQQCWLLRGHHEHSRLVRSPARCQALLPRLCPLLLLTGGAVLPSGAQSCREHCTAADQHHGRHTSTANMHRWHRACTHVPASRYQHFRSLGTHSYAGSFCKTRRSLPV